mmetsp:Transcript_133094/g.385011  ORF Transcript_133094/g.385011 Transcript_133094/m.385011 type:complete len:266 (+) Transcript_133094:1241-2038(+)
MRLWRPWRPACATWRRPWRRLLPRPLRQTPQVRQAPSLQPRAGPSTTGRRQVRSAPSCCRPRPAPAAGPPLRLRSRTQPLARLRTPTLQRRRRRASLVRRQTPAPCRLSRRTPQLPPLQPRRAWLRPCESVRTRPPPLSRRHLRRSTADTPELAMWSCLRRVQTRAQLTCIRQPRLPTMALPELAELAMARHARHPRHRRRQLSRPRSRQMHWQVPQFPGAMACQPYRWTFHHRRPAQRLRAQRLQMRRQRHCAQLWRRHLQPPL